MLNVSFWHFVFLGIYIFVLTLFPSLFELAYLFSYLFIPVISLISLVNSSLNLVMNNERQFFVKNSLINSLFFWKNALIFQIANFSIMFCILVLNTLRNLSEKYLLFILIKVKIIGFVAKYNKYKNMKDILNPIEFIAKYNKYKNLKDILNLIGFIAKYDTKTWRIF